MEQASQILDFLDSFLGSAIWFPYTLLGVGIWFTIYLGFPQIRYFKRAWAVLSGREARDDAEGDTTHFQALSTALSGTVGTGNIGGVAFALFLGGPAALFWMWATAAVGMTTKFVEVTLSHKYREKDDDGFIAGGPMYYMEKRLNMKWLGIAFAIATVICAVGTGCLPQSNNLASGLETSFGITPWITGLVLAVLLAAVILGGIKRIAAVTSRIVPFMAAVYVIGAFAVIFSNYEQIIPSFLSIFSSIFTTNAAVGGFLGASFAYAFSTGVNRGLFSNEAGQGSAPIAHASAKADDPVPEGLVSLLEPFIDTLVICTLTGLAILASGAWMTKYDNDFDLVDVEFIEQVYDESNVAHAEALATHLGRLDASGNPVVLLEGEVSVNSGELIRGDYTVIHNHSIAEDVRVFLDGVPFTGVMEIVDGKPPSDYDLHGKSLVHSVSLTVEAFKTSFFGDYGQYAVTVSLVLFAFSTAIAWSYYGDRAITYMFGTKWLLPYRILYCVAFFAATIMNTGIVWKVAAVGVVVMAVPNLVGITLLSKEMKETVANFMRLPKPERKVS